MKEKFSIKLVKVAAIALVFGLVAGSAFTGVLAVYNHFNRVKDSGVKISTSDGLLDTTSVSTATTVTDVSDIVDNVMPAVVAVTNKSTVTYRSFFGGPTNYETVSAGSGIIFAQDAEKIYIATNNHVIANASTITITFYDKKEATAKVIGTASSSDLAVVAVDISELSKDTINKIKTATIGDSSNIKVGESAVVIGNSLGYGQTVTTGIISALEREVSLRDEDGDAYKASLIQTDAAVNPGNSGGALLNMNGQVVGIVSAKYSSTEVEGVGYAIPISQASSIISSIITGKSNNNNKTQEAYLGIGGVDITRSIALSYSLPSGVYVSKVYKGTGADEAGLKKGDVICAIDGRDIASMDEIAQYLKSYNANDVVELTIASPDDGYKTKQVKVTLTVKE